MSPFSTIRSTRHQRYLLGATWVLLAAWPSLCLVHGQESEADRYWPQWRGPLATGVSPHGEPPTEWDEQSGKNIRWKVPVPGKGHSTPIVWDNLIFLTTAIPIGDPLPPRYSGAPGAHDNAPITHKQEFAALAISRPTGKIVWQRTLGSQLPHEGAHFSGSLASGSPVTDGKHVVFHFGSYGLFCLDFAGNTLWQSDLGVMNTKHGHGEGSSPTLFGDTCVVNWDHEGQSYVVAFDVASGVLRWKKTRDEVTSWSSPIVVEHENRAQVIVAGTSRVRAYDLMTGDVIWECGGLSHNIVATPVAGDGLVFVGSSYEKKAMLAIRLEGAAGDITGSANVVWSRVLRTPYVPSPLLYGDALYFLRHYQGILTRVDAKTGDEPTGPFRLSGIEDVYASPVGAAGHVYVSDRDGTTLVFQHGTRPAPVATNQLADGINASAAIAGDELFIRTEKKLYCIAVDVE